MDRQHSTRGHLASVARYGLGDLLIKITARRVAGRYPIASAGLGGRSAYERRISACSGEVQCDERGSFGNYGMGGIMATDAMIGEDHLHGRERRAAAASTSRGTTDCPLTAAAPRVPAAGATRAWASGDPAPAYSRASAAATGAAARAETSSMTAAARARTTSGDAACSPVIAPAPGPADRGSAATPTASVIPTRHRTTGAA